MKSRAKVFSLNVIGRYAQAGVAQMMQSTACNARHHIQERCARWLLMTHDRVGRDDFELSHEFLAVMLGVRRQSVTVVAGTLQRAGLLTYKHGRITVLDRTGLEAASCECYAAIRRRFDSLLQVANCPVWDRSFGLESVTSLLRHRHGFKAASRPSGR